MKNLLFLGDHEVEGDMGDLGNGKEQQLKRMEILGKGNVSNTDEVILNILKELRDKEGEADMRCVGG